VISICFVLLVCLGSLRKPSKYGLNRWYAMFRGKRWVFGGCL